MNYAKLTIGGQEVQVNSFDELPILIDYSLEDPENFQFKESADAVQIKVPATLLNQRTANAFHDSDSVDGTASEFYKSQRSCSIEANGYEVFNGKAVLLNASHNATPKEYEFALYGDNADWVIDLQEKTIYDFIKQISFTFSKANIQASWVFDGTNENLPYVFVPIRYRLPFGGYTVQTIGDTQQTVAVDDNIEVEYLRPSLSLYWILYWGFKSVGYKIHSDFFSEEYFRRLVMPWTWGNFLDSDGTKLNIHRFLAKSSEYIHYRNGSDGKKEGVIDLEVSNDTTNGAYDNNGDYTYVAPVMTFTYQAPDFGTVKAHFSLDLESSIDLNAKSGGVHADCEVRVQWFKNGVLFDSGIGEYNAHGNKVLGITSTDFNWHVKYFNIDSQFCTSTISLGDIITAKVYVKSYASKANSATVDAYFNVQQFTLDYLKIATGGTISFVNYTAFQNYKFLDLLKGAVDLFNLSFTTDPVSKVVYIEPTHPYYLENDPTDTNDGYFKNDWVEWNGKEDLSKDWVMQNFSEYERELFFRYRDDSNDGILKTVQDRNLIKLAQGKYLLPQRFKQGKKEFENRFFSPLMHYDADQFKAITGVSPQLPCIIPENISNTSQSESDNTFLPKLGYYKGNVSSVGGWRWDGDNETTLPFLFSVNYKSGGESDPILSYSDENINGTLGKGLLTRFFTQRMAILRNGQWYNAWFRLKNSDVTGQLHREYKSYKGHRWELVQIKDFKPLVEDAVACLIRRHEPISQVDDDNIFPSDDSVLGSGQVSDFDMKYNALKCLISDIPK
jgi:hypothetical protein